MRLYPQTSSSQSTPREKIHAIPEITVTNPRQKAKTQTEYMPSVEELLPIKDMQNSIH
jgi:hypothetical protein